MIQAILYLTSGFLWGDMITNHFALLLSSYNKANSSEIVGTKCNAKEQTTKSKGSAISGGTDPEARSENDSG